MHLVLPKSEIRIPKSLIVFYTHSALCVSPTRFDRFDSQSSISRDLCRMPFAGLGATVGGRLPCVLDASGTAAAAILPAVR